MGSNKKIAMVIFVLFVMQFLGIRSVSAQTFGEFFNQKKTQKRYLLEQLAALKVYAGYLKKGYEIVGNGVGMVRDLKNGEFGLHSAFFGSLKAVSPAIRNNAKVAETISLQLGIVRAFGTMSDHELLTVSNRNYIDGVREKVMNECAADLEELLIVITSGKVEMSDDERIQRLDKVYGSMRDKSTFVQSFTGDVGLLVRQRQNELQSISEIRRYYEQY